VPSPCDRGSPFQLLDGGEPNGETGLRRNMWAEPFSLLESDHRHVEAMLESLAESEPDPDREELLRHLTAAFEARAHFEEQAVYPHASRVMDAETEGRRRGRAPLGPRRSGQAR
jgi:hypothetical protein